MKLKFRVFGILCAACILLSSSVYAAEAEPLSANAGETARCTIVIANEDGSQETRTLEVPIPAGATRDEERALVRTAVFGENTNSTQSTLRAGPFTELSVVNDLPYMIDFTETYVGGGTMPETCPTLTVEFENLMPGNGAKILYIRLKNVTYNQEWVKQIDMSPINDWVYFMYSRDPGLKMEKGNRMEVYAHPDTGYAEADSCTVNISPYDMG
ncbi:hypothetical protein [Pseudoflavonifractor phocaeensis]|uniref:hypothetical protein n=1 Tax=Pseudoflavonifractor phocaeensis TaxID=1870988 RepID=UPI0019590617|nr:hypothetical protein [Pseudoflavonifractor phocaeensis]MBM6887962.1 hypothetical protein [Pseudoflavonifractor phocaeensis]